VNYRIEISTNQGTQLSAAPAKSLPVGWSNVGENVGAGAGNDGSSDGRLSVSVGTANVTNANFGVTLGTTAAHVGLSGRLSTSDGRGLMNATVILTDFQGRPRITTTSSFGYFHFDDIEIGQTYLLSVSSKRYQFSPRVIAIFDEIADVEMVANN
jgi:hypothetical protein